MRRRAPRRLGEALRSFATGQAPETLLARVQSCWVATVGKVVAEEAQPVSERAGTITVTCRSAAWASEMELLGPELVERLNQALGEASGGPVEKLRARVGKLP